MRIALAGNPNSGKTTLFNGLTKSRAKVSNYPGVTVEKRQGNLSLPAREEGADATEAVLIDLPGCYSLSARSPEEDVAHQVLMGGLINNNTPVDLVVCVADATNLGRSLYLVAQLMELGRPLIIALNMMDSARDRKLHIDAARLSAELGVAVVPTVARTQEGLHDLISHCSALYDAQKKPTYRQPPLSDADRRTLEEAHSILGERAATLGDTLWYLTSSPEQHGLEPALSAGLAALFSSTQEADLYARRVIESRYSVVDAWLEAIELNIDDLNMGRDTTTERIDRWLLHPVWGSLLFVLSMFVLFQAVFAWADPMIALVESWVTWASALAENFIPAGLTQSLVAHGLIAGVGNVLVFLPQIALLFFGIAVLEESGYLARSAVLLDKIMRRVGLDGKAFVPLMGSFACAVPGIMATRTIASSRDRIVTIMIAPFMSCSARLPVYTLVIAALFSTLPPVFGVLSVGGLLITAMYLLGFVVAIGTAFILKRTILKSPTPPLLLELPSYRLPQWGAVFQQVYRRARVFVSQTGSVILALSIILWGLLTFPQQGLAPKELQEARVQIAQLPSTAQKPAEDALERRDRVARLRNTVGGQIGLALEPVVEPLGFDWRIAIGLVASFAAREVLVSTLAQVYALDANVEADSLTLREALLFDVDPHTKKPKFSPLVGLSLMVFFVLAMQCLSTVATVKRETNSWRWPLVQLFYMNGLAYLASLAVYQGGRLLGWG